MNSYWEWNKENFDWQIDLAGGDDESLTWANLWVNGNYPSFVNEILRKQEKLWKATITT